MNKVFKYPRYNSISKIKIQDEDTLGSMDYIELGARCDYSAEP